MQRAPYLVTALLGILAARGMTADAIDPWRGWIAFKHFARVVAEVPDPGVSVQLLPQADGSASLMFLRQVVEGNAEGLEPIGGVVCELRFPAGAVKRRGWEFWSFDHPTFERFVDRVEQHPPFADLVLRRPEWSAVYWEDADPEGPSPLEAA